MADDQSLLVLKQILNNLPLAVGRVPAPKFDNLAEWDRIAPPITQAAEGVSMALRDRNPVLASILLEIAAKCAAMREAIKGDEESPPAPERIRHREQQIRNGKPTSSAPSENWRNQNRRCAFSCAPSNQSGT